MQNLKIRDAQATDIPALAALGNPNPDGYFARCFVEQAEGKRIILVAEIAGQIVGYVFLNMNPRYQMFRRLEIPEIQDLYVTSAARRQGVGEALVQSCEDRAHALGIMQMGIAVGLHAGFGAAQRLYARRDYVPDGAGVMYDRAPVHAGDMRLIDDDLTLMLVKEL